MATTPRGAMITYTNGDTTTAKDVETMAEDKLGVTLRVWHDDTAGIGLGILIGADRIMRVDLPPAGDASGVHRDIEIRGLLSGDVLKIAAAATMTALKTLRAYVCQYVAAG